MLFDPFDFIIVGAGLSGGVVARELAETGKKVLIIERRNHIAGNMFDYHDERGFLVQKYGPHTFHTKDESLYEYMKKYGEWEPYKLKCGASWGGKYSPTPFNFQTIDTFYPEKEAKILKSELLSEFPNREFVTVVELLEAKSSNVRNYASFLFKEDYAPYTSKQWGVSPETIDVSILKRVPVRLSYKEGYFDDPYQVMPKDSFTTFFENLLNHPNIEVRLGTDALELLTLGTDRFLFDGKEIKQHVVYTGALDTLFEYCYGELPYRSLKFEWFYEDIESKQPVAVLAYPQEKGFTRVTEYKKLPYQNIRGTVYAVEYPLAASYKNKLEPYYPVLTAESRALYEEYSKLFAKFKNVSKCGRLADFRYYNMDQTLANALSLVKRLKDTL